VLRNLPMAIMAVELPAPASAAEPGEPGLGASGLARIWTGLRRHGGTWVSFADRLLLAGWPAEDRPLKEAIAGAAGCLLDQESGLFASLAGAAACRVALVAGPASAGVVGGTGGDWQPVLTGQLVAELFQALQGGRPGELVLGPSAQAHWNGQAVSVERRRGLGVVQLVQPRATSLELATEPLRTPPARLRSLHGAVVAVQVEGLDPARVDVLARLHQAVRLMQRLVKRHGGGLHSVQHSPAGITAWASFEDDEDDRGRAALAALRFGCDLDHDLADLGLQAPMGAAHGAFRCWSVDAQSAVALGVEGRVLGRALRALQASSSELVCDRQVADRLGDGARLEAIELPEAAGQEGDLLRVESIPTEPASRQQVLTGLVGRGEELRRLQPLLDDLLAGTGGVAIIEGEPGFGKSRLVAELVARLSRQGVVVTVGYGQPDAGASPLEAWRSVVHQLLDARQDSASEQGGTALSSWMRSQDELEPQLGVLSQLLGLPGAEGREDSEGSARRQQALCDLVASLRADRLLLVVIEDAQWLDSASWALAHEIASTQEGLLVLMSLRSGHAEELPEYQRLAALPGSRVLTLRGLSVAALHRLLAVELELERLPESLVSWIHRTGGGNPLFCLQLLRSMQEDGELIVEQGRILRAPIKEQLGRRSQLHSLEHCLELRARRLPQAPQRTLAVLSLAGSAAETELLVEVHPDGVGRLRVEADLERLVSAGLIQPAHGRDTPAWTVTHPAVAASALAALDEPQRAGLHRAIATWYEQRLDDLSPVLPLLARHWLRGGDRSQAMRFLELAGAQAMGAGAMPEAVTCYQRALRLAEPLASESGGVALLRRAHWERQLGDARYACGELDRCTVHFERALGLLGQRMPRSRAGLVVSLLGQLARQVAHRLLPDRLVAAARARRPRLLEASHAAERLAERYYYSADLLSLAVSSVMSANLADRVGPDASNARPYASMSVLAALARLDGLSSRLHQRALRIGEQAPDPSGLVVALYTRGAHHAGRGEWSQARELGERAVAAAQRVAAWQEQGVAQTVVGLASYLPGRFGPAESAFGELLVQARQRYNGQHEAWAHYGLAQCQLQRGRLDESVREVGRALHLLRSLEDHPSRLICQGLLGSAHLRAGRLGPAREAADLARALISHLRYPGVVAHLDGFAGAAEVYLSLWAREPGQAALGKLARSSLAALGRYARVFPVGAPRLALLRGRFELARERPERATRCWQRGITRARQLGMGMDEGLLALELGTRGTLAGRERDEHRSLARSRLALLGCGYHLKQLEEAVTSAR